MGKETTLTSTRSNQQQLAAPALLARRLKINSASDMARDGALGRADATWTGDSSIEAVLREQPLRKATSDQAFLLIRTSL